MGARAQRAENRERTMLEAVRIFMAASRDSTQTVLAALDRTLRAFDPSLDAVLVFRCTDEELACVYASGARCEHYAGLRLRCDNPRALPARAALEGHRVELDAEGSGVIPTDRAALAIPMIDEGRASAVVYASSAKDTIRDAEVLVSAVAQAAEPYALAAERESDRARATFDNLTGLHTPRAFRERLQQHVALARLQHQGAAFGLWFVDTDKFKDVNDRFGHAAGDVVLQRMAALLREHTVVGVDLPARNGGDEFCTIVDRVHKVAAIERAQRFCDAVRACDFGIGVPITASIGVAAYPYDATEANELLEAADAAMYHSKRAGRGCVSFAVKGAGFAVYR